MHVEIPEKLIQILENPDIVKAGVGIQGQSISASWLDAAKVFSLQETSINYTKITRSM